MWPTAGKLWRLIWRVWIAVRCRVAAITAGYLHRRLGVTRDHGIGERTFLDIEEPVETSATRALREKTGLAPGTR